MENCNSFFFFYYQGHHFWYFFENSSEQAGSGEVEHVSLGFELAELIYLKATEWNEAVYSVAVAIDT